MDTREVVYQIRCSEPDGEVVRTVRLCKLTIEKLGFFWQKLSQFDTLFNDFVRGDFAAFVNHFVQQVDGEPVPAGLIWEVDDVGLFLLNEIKVGHSGKAHFVFWDRRFSGREALCRGMLEYVMEEYDLLKISVEVPVYANHTLQAVEKIGFVREGRIRRDILYKGNWFDVNVYSILKGETFEPNKYVIRQVCFKCGNTYPGDKHGTESTKGN